MLDSIGKCFMLETAVCTRHARQEMLGEERGIITDAEVFQTIQAGEVIESYPDDDTRVC